MSNPVIDVKVNGSTVAWRHNSLSIHKAASDEPGQCSIVLTAAPSVDQTLKITLNDGTNYILFSGIIQTVDKTYEGRTTQLVYPCTAIDTTSRANRRLPFGTWTDVSASTVVAAIVSSFCPGCTATHVEASLPVVTVVLDGSEGVNGALRQIATLVGGYFYWDDFDLHFFITDTGTTPNPIQSGYPFLDNPPLRITSDETQVRTRVFGKGYGDSVATNVNASDAIVPITNSAYFNPAGGKAITDSQVLTYTGIHTGVGGGLVGPGASPSSAPALAVGSGTGVTAGVHGYAVTFVTAAGESIGSPSASIESDATPIASVLSRLPSGGSPPEVGSWQVKVTWIYSSGLESLASPASNAITLTGPNDALSFTLPIGPAGVVKRRVYLRNPSSAVYRAWDTSLYDIPNNTATSGSASGGMFGPLTAEPTGHIAQVAVTGIPIGGTGVTSRKVYRTAAGASQLKLLTTIANNTATTFTDTTADGSLGANIPTSDTSGLAQPTGQVTAGGTSLIVAGTGAFASGGGWAIVGNGQQIIRYTGVTGSALTGIPASGNGSLASSVSYNATITPCPALTGVTGNSLALVKGRSVNIWVQRESVAGQAALAARDGTDGIIEYRVVDERRAEASLISLCDAELARFALPIVTVVYATRDPKTRAGAPVLVNLASPSINQTLTIQDVVISEVGLKPTLYPKYTVTASSLRFSLEDLLRRGLQGAGV